MKKFRVENTYNGQSVIVTLYEPPYEDENVLYKTGWKQKDVTITEITMELEDE